MRYQNANFTGWMSGSRDRQNFMTVISRSEVTRKAHARNNFDSPLGSSRNPFKLLQSAW